MIVEISKSLMQKPIHLFRPYFRIDECLQEIRNCLEIGWTGMGYKTIELEESWRIYTEHNFAHFVNSSTSGLVLALETLKEAHLWPDGAEIITTGITFVSTNQSILLAGLIPSFADTDKTLNLCPESVEKCINSNTVAVMFVGIGGNPDNYNEIRELCVSHNLVLILDAAHMAGTKVDGQTVGLDTDVSIYSFQAVKNLPTADSGMVCFKDEQLDTIARKRSWVGIDSDTFTRTQSSRAYKWYYEVEYCSGKYHGNSVMASLGLVALRYLDDDNRVRRYLASLYDKHLEGIAQITTISHGQRVSGSTVSSRHLYQIMVAPEVRDILIAYLNEADIYPGVHYRSNLEYKIFKKYADLNDFKNTTLQSSSLISLPLSVGLSEVDIERVSSRIASFFK